MKETSQFNTTNTNTMRECERCHSLLPSIKLFRWRCNYPEKNDVFKDCNLCNSCYQNLKTKGYEMTEDGKIVRKRLGL